MWLLYPNIDPLTFTAYFVLWNETVMDQRLHSLLHKWKETDVSWMLFFQARSYSVDSSYNDDIHFNSKDRRLGERPSLTTLVRSIREQVNLCIIISLHWVVVLVDALCCYEFKKQILIASIYDGHTQFQKFLTTDILWWRGLTRILEAKGYIREGDDKVYLLQLEITHPCILILLIKLHVHWIICWKCWICCHWN